MQLTQLIQRFRDYCAYDQDPIGQSLSDSSVIDHLNEAMFEIGSELGSTSATVSVTLQSHQAVVSLVGPASSRMVILPQRVLLGAREIPALAPLEIDDRFPGWRDWPPGSPRCCLVLDSSTLQLVPAPASGGETLTVVGEILPIPLTPTQPDQEPNLHPLLHSSIARLAAYNVCRPNATEPQQVQRLENLRVLALQKVLEVKRRNLIASGSDLNRRRHLSRVL